MCNYTRRTFGGRGPLCGIGVTSCMDNISNPWFANDRIAASRPEPTPRTNTWICIGPDFLSFSVNAPTIFEAANGVAFLGPENPSDPADAHASTFPFSSVTVTTVLLY